MASVSEASDPVATFSTGRRPVTGEATLNVFERSVNASPDRCFFAIACARFAIVLALVGNPVSAGSLPLPDDAPSGSGSFVLTGHVMANGGTTRARSPCFDLAASIGQPVSGSTQGGAYSLYAGFLGPSNPHDSIFRSSFEVCQP